MLVDSDEGATRTGVLKGKLRYMAPEQVGGADINRRSDLFSVGVMLWEDRERRVSPVVHTLRARYMLLGR